MSDAESMGPAADDLSEGGGEAFGLVGGAVVVRDGAAGGCRQTGRHRGIGEHAAQLIGPIIRNSMVHDQRGLVGNKNIEIRVVGRDGRHAGGHCLKDDRADLSLTLGQDQHVAAGQQGSVQRGIDDA